MTKTPLQLDKFLPYRLSIASNLVSDAIARAYARRFSINVPEWRLVAVIAEAQGLSQQAICARTRMDKVTVSRAAISLFERGLIHRAPNPQDGRSHILSLSSEGLALYCKVAPEARKLEEQIFGKLNEKELQRFSETLQLITETAEQIAE